MLTNPEDVHARAVGQLGLGEHIAQHLRLGELARAVGRGGHVTEGVQAKFELGALAFVAELRHTRCNHDDAANIPSNFNF
ncbi:hypothetical protein GCM10009771_11010 [Nesterenkonia flava]